MSVDGDSVGAMTTLYHFTSKQQLSSILSTGELFMTPNPHISVPGQKYPVLWLSTESGEGRTGATTAAGLNLDKAVNGILVNRTEIRITVDVPEAEVQTWEKYADKYNVNPTVIRQLAKWPKHPEWWVAFERSIPAEEWVEVAQGGQGSWLPMLSPDEPVEAADGD